MQYHILHNGNQYGPMEVSELANYGLSLKSQVWTAGWESWKKAADVPEISEFIEHNLKIWYVGRDNNESGPYSMTELEKIGLTPTTLVWTDGMPDWMTAERVPALKSIIGVAATARPVATPPPPPAVQTGKTTPPTATTTTQQDSVGSPLVMPLIAGGCMLAYFSLLAWYHLYVYYYFVGSLLNIISSAVPVTAVAIGIVRAIQARSIAKKQGNFAKACRASGAATAAGIIGIVASVVSILFIVLL